MARIPGGVEALIPPLRERSETLLDFVEGAAPYLVESMPMDEAAATKHLTAAIAPTLQEFADLVEAVSQFSDEILEQVLHGLIERRGLKMGKLAQPRRVALTGRTVSPAADRRRRAVRVLGRPGGRERPAVEWQNSQPRHLRSHGPIGKRPDTPAHPGRCRPRPE